MPRSFGFWLNPKTGESHSVTTHQDWILDNAALLGVQDTVHGLDPHRDEDRIRIVGCQAGLVRIRDYGPRLSCQFWAIDQSEITTILKAVHTFLVNELAVGPLKSVWVHNLAHAAQATLGAGFLGRCERGS